MGNKKDLIERIEKAPDEIKKCKIVNDLIRQGEVARSRIATSQPKNKRMRWKQSVLNCSSGTPGKPTEARFFKRDALEQLLEQGCITENDCDTYNTLRGHLRVVKNISRRTKLKNQFDALNVKFTRARNMGHDSCRLRRVETMLSEVHNQWCKHKDCLNQRHKRLSCRTFLTFHH